jgi:ferrous iron transport protein B
MRMSTLEVTYPATFAVDYGRTLETEIDALCREIGRYPAITQKYPARWLAINLLEQDPELQQQILHLPGGPAVLTHAQMGYGRLAEKYGADVDAIIADRRYGWIHNLVNQAVQRTRTDRYTRSDKIDRFVTHRFWGILIFLALMWLVFKLTADLSAPYVDWIGGVLAGPVTHGVVALLTAVGLGGSWVEGLLVDGVIAGVGGVLVFIPVLMSLYLALAVLEDSGYMARAAFVMDSLMNKIGLHGKSFLPLMVGFGCSVPAIYATRTLENKKDRVLTALLVPFMSCGARLPVYVLFAAIFFPLYAGTVIFGLYLLGILTAIFLGLLLRRTVFQTDETTAFVMELPPYRMPTAKSIWFHMWQRTREFLENAWTLILAVSIVIWLLMSVPVGATDGSFADTPVDDSAFAAAAGVISPALQPLGFGSWQSAGALMSGFVAKEVVVSTMAQVYGVAEEEETAVEPASFLEDVWFVVTSFVQATIDSLKMIPSIFGINLFSETDAEPSDLMAAIKNGFEETSGGHGALAALSFLVFVLIYTPCMVAIAAEKQELGAIWMWVSVIGQFILAWVMAFLIFQGGKLLSVFSGQFSVFSG